MRWDAPSKGTAPPCALRPRCPRPPALLPAGRPPPPPLPASPFRFFYRKDRNALELPLPLELHGLVHEMIDVGGGVT